jgi:hypothetical protein
MMYLKNFIGKYKKGSDPLKYPVLHYSNPAFVAEATSAGRAAPILYIYSHGCTRT